MNRLLFIVVFAASAIFAAPPDPFYAPISGFADALMPILTGFEKAKVETTLRGFIARADSAPGFAQSEMDPSEFGLYLNVSVRDAEEVKANSDRTEQKGVFNRRTVRIPPPDGGGQAIVIELDYGRKITTEVLGKIDKCISAVVSFSKQSPKP